MATTTTHPPIRVERLHRNGWGSAYYNEGQGLEMAALGFTEEQFEQYEDEHPGFMAWDRVLSEVRAEIGPQVRDLFYEALERRLPWTWEAER